MADIRRTLPLQRSSVQDAHERIKEHIHRTPVLTSTTLSTLASTPQTPEALIGTPYEGQTPARPRINFFFKCENFQRIGAFKIRGAFHALSRLTDEELARGVVTHSSGTPPLPQPTPHPCPSQSINKSPTTQATTPKPWPSQPARTTSPPTSSCPPSRPRPKSPPPKATAQQCISAAAHRRSAKPSWQT